MTARQASGWQGPIPPPSEWLAAYPPLRRAGAGAYGPCPLCGGDDRFHVGPKGGRTLFECRVCMEGQPEAVRRRRCGQVLRAVFGDGPANPPGQPRAAPRIDPQKAAKEAADQQRKLDYVAACWAASTAIPRDPQHPARRWLWHRKGGEGPALWQPDIPVPSPVRYLEALPVKGFPYGYGQAPPGPVIMVALATAGSWISAWPATPPPQALAVHFIDHDGRGVRRFGGKNKVAWGSKTGAFGLIGNPTPDTGDTLNVCEGLADGLGIASRQMGSVLITFARPLSHGPAFDYMRRWTSVELYSDNDPRSQHGQRDAAKARAGLIRAGVDVLATVCDRPTHKDFADCCEDGEYPLTPLQDYRKDVVELAEGWEAQGYPQEEAARLAGLTLLGPDLEPESTEPLDDASTPETFSEKTEPQQQGFDMPPAGLPH